MKAAISRTIASGCSAARGINGENRGEAACSACGRGGAGRGAGSVIPSVGPSRVSGLTARAAYGEPMLPSRCTATATGAVEADVESGLGTRRHVHRIPSARRLPLLASATHSEASQPRLPDELVGDEWTGTDSVPPVGPLLINKRILALLDALDDDSVPRAVTDLLSELPLLRRLDLGRAAIDEDFCPLPPLGQSSAPAAHHLPWQSDRQRHPGRPSSALAHTPERSGGRRASVPRA